MDDRKRWLGIGALGLAALLVSMTPVRAAACVVDADCDDLNLCTMDACAAGVCQNTVLPDGASCGDGVLCNGYETCLAGVCTPGTAVNCQTIGGDIYTGNGSVRFLYDLADPVGEPTTVYDNCVTHTPAGSVLSPITGLPLTGFGYSGLPDPGPPGGPAVCPPLTGAQVMVQDQADGSVVAYGDVTGSSWTATVDADLHPDLIVMFGAPGHDVTSREFSYNPTLGTYTHPIPGVVGVSGALGVGAGGNLQDAYLPPLVSADPIYNADPTTGSYPIPPPDPNGQLPRACLLHFTYYDKFVNGAFDGEIIEAGLNGVTVTLTDEAGNVLASGLTGDVNADGLVDENDKFVTMDGLGFWGGPGFMMPWPGMPGGVMEAESIHGFVYFCNLPPDLGEITITSNARTVTQAANPHFNLYIQDDIQRNIAGWSMNYTDEGTANWGAPISPGDPGTEMGFYLTWHGFFENIGQIGGPNNPTPFNPALVGSISGTILDADGNDPEEPIPTMFPGRVDGGFANGYDVEANARIFNGRVALYTLPVQDGDTYELYAVTDATQPSCQTCQDGAEFNFVNVPPGVYELFAYDTPLYFVPFPGTGISVLPGQDVETSLLVPRFGARAMGYVINNTTGLPVPGATVKIHYESGSTKHETTTVSDPADPNGLGYFMFEFLPEIEVMAHIYVELPDGSTTRGAIITEMYDGDAGGPAFPFPVTHNAMNRYLQWMTFNYYVDIRVEDVPAATGDINGVVFYDTLGEVDGLPDGLRDESREGHLEGVRVELWDATGTTLIDAIMTGAFDGAEVKAQGWAEPGTWPVSEVGGVYAGPTALYAPALPVIDPIADTLPAPQPGRYEFRDLAPGNYMIKVVPPADFTYSPSPDAVIAGADGEAAVVVAGTSEVVDIGTTTQPIDPITGLPTPTGVPRAGGTEGGVFDDMGPLDPNPLSLLWDEKAAIVGAPVTVNDQYGYLLGVMFMNDPLCYDGSTVCPSPCPVLGQSPDAHRLFAPGTHRFIGNGAGFCEDMDGDGVLSCGEDVNGNGNLDCYDPFFDPMDLAYTFPSGGFKFEADWSLIPAPGTFTPVDICTTALVGTAVGAGAQVDVTVQDDAGVPVSGATVEGSWTSPIADGSCITDFTGTCSITLEQSTLPTTFSVTNVIPNELWYVYNPAGAGCLNPPQVTIGPCVGCGGGITLTGIGIDKGEGKWKAEVIVTGDPGTVFTYDWSFPGCPWCGEVREKKIEGGTSITVKSEDIFIEGSPAVPSITFNLLTPEIQSIEIFKPWAAAVGWPGGGPTTTAELTKDETKCQQMESKALGKFVQSKAKCLAKCDKDLQKGKAQAGDCEPPFGGKTAACVVKAESKAAALITKKCVDPEPAKDACPECYSGGDCEARRDQQVAAAEFNVETFIPLVFCDDSGSPDGLNDDEAKCRQAIASEGGKANMKRGKCTAKCWKFVHKGKLNPSDCFPGAVTHQRTLDCMAKVRTKLVDKLAKKCADAPECVEAVFGSPVGPGFAVAIELAQDLFPSAFCSSPSGAFLDGSSALLD